MFSRSPLLLLTAALACGQAPVEVSGRVLEAGTSVGIEGVHIEANSYAGLTPLHAEATTSATGAFTLSLSRDGAWSVFIKKDGYSIASGSNMGINVTRDAPPRDVGFLMQRRATITGHVEDAESREPVVGLALSIEPAVLGGEAALAGGLPSNPNSRTDTEGKFVYSSNPGSWIVRVLPRISVGRVRTDFKPEDIGKIDEDYEDFYWPGGFDRASALPVIVASGAAGDAGTLRLRKTKYYRALFTFPAKGCEAGAKYQARITRPASPAVSQVVVREVEFPIVCGQDVLLTALKPGSYSADFYPVDRDPPTQPWSLNRFQITRENVRLNIALATGPDLEGRFVAAEGAGKLPIDNLHGSVMHVNWGTSAERRDFWPDAEGRFHVPNLPVDRWYAGFLVNPPEGWILSDVRFRGVSLSRNLGRQLYEFNWDGSGAVEIVLDDKPGSVRGTVMSNGKPVTDAIVLLYPLPMPPTGYATTFPEREVPTRPDGSFAFEQLPAGEYRTFPVSRSSYMGRGRLLTAFPPGSEKVTVPRGGTATADLRLIPDPK